MPLGMSSMAPASAALFAGYRSDLVLDIRGHLALESHPLYLLQTDL